AFAESQHLAAAGAIDLSLRLLGDSQPSYTDNPDGWRRYHEARVEILLRGERWTEMVELLDSLPPDLVLADRRRAQTLLARAWLAQGDGERAAEVLRSLIWSSEPKSDEELRLWRRQLIHAWEAADQLEAARV